MTILVIIKKLKGLDQIIFFDHPTYLNFLRFWYQSMAHIFRIHILEFVIPKLEIYEEVIKNVLNN